MDLPIYYYSMGKDENTSVKALVSVRDLSENDIPLVLNYWFRSPPGYVESMGVDLKKMPKESEMETTLREKLLMNKKLNASKLTGLVTCYDKQPIGIHSLYPLYENEYGIFHAHILDSQFRRRGIGLHSYPKACRIYFERFNLKRIVFKTPIQNVGAIRVKEKLGIRCIGEEIIDSSIIKAGTLAKVFELTRSEADQMLF